MSGTSERRNGHVALVTGATSGLGCALAATPAAGGATALVHGCEANRGPAAVAELRRRSGRGFPSETPQLTLLTVRKQPLSLDSRVVMLDKRPARPPPGNLPRERPLPISIGQFLAVLTRSGASDGAPDGTD
jgi:hypothetical protein